MGIIVFALDNRVSFEAVTSWKSKVQKECGDIPLVLVQNKSDLKDLAQVADPDVEDLCKRLGLPLFRSSVKLGTNVSEVFDYLTAQYFKKDKSKS